MGRVSTCQKNCISIDLRRAQVSHRHLHTNCDWSLYGFKNKKDHRVVRFHKACFRKDIRIEIPSVVNPKLVCLYFDFEVSDFIFCNGICMRANFCGVSCVKPQAHIFAGKYMWRACVKLFLGFLPLSSNSLCSLHSVLHKWWGLSTVKAPVIRSWKERKVLGHF